MGQPPENFLRHFGRLETFLPNLFCHAFAGEEKVGERSPTARARGYRVTAILPQRYVTHLHPLRRLQPLTHERRRSRRLRKWREREMREGSGTCQQEIRAWLLPNLSAACLPSWCPKPPLYTVTTNHLCLRRRRVYTRTAPPRRAEFGASKEPPPRPAPNTPPPPRFYPLFLIEHHQSPSSLTLKKAARQRLG